MLIDAPRLSSLPHPMPPRTVDPGRFRAAARHLAAAVGIVATDGHAGRHGRTVSAACTVTLDPPTLLVCIDRKGPLAGAIRANGGFAFSVLGRGARDTAKLFAGSSSSDGAARFAAGDWRDAAGSPRLADAEAAFACRLAEIVDVGTHAVILGEVVETWLSEAPAQPLLYHDGAYGGLHRLPD